MSEAPARVTVTIDRVVLRGLDQAGPADRKALLAGLQTELARMLANPVMRAALTRNGAGSRRTPVLRLGRMQLGPGTAGARTLGTGIARAIGKGMGR